MMKIHWEIVDGQKSRDSLRGHDWFSGERLCRMVSSVYFLVAYQTRFSDDGGRNAAVTKVRYVPDINSAVLPEDAVSSFPPIFLLTCYIDSHF